MAWRSTSTAIAGTQPNLRDSGHSAPSPSVSTRQNTRAPGAARAIFSTSSDAVDGKEADAELEGARDVALLLDRVAEGDALGRRAGVHAPSRSRRPTRCRRTSPSRQAGAGSRAPGLPSPRSRSANRAAPSRRRGNCRARRRGRRRGKGRPDVGWRGNRGCAGWPSVSPSARFPGGDAAQGCGCGRFPAAAFTRWTKARTRFSMEPAGGDPGTMRRASRGDEPWPMPGRGSLCLPWLGWETRPHCRQ